MEQASQSLAATFYAGEARRALDLPQMKVAYAWLPPFEGASTQLPNRLEVVFSRHPRVALQHAGRTYDVDVPAGAFFVTGETPMTLLRVPEHSDTLEIYPDPQLLRRASAETGRSIVLEPTLGPGAGPRRFGIDGVMLALSHVLRQACLGLRPLTPLEASSLEYLVAGHLMGAYATGRLVGGLAPAALARVVACIEDDLAGALTLDRLADEANLSVFHFARAFRRSTGLAPHRYVLARRLERAKNDLLNTRRSAVEIAAAVGFENPHHFRRQFRAQFGVLPGALREVALSQDRRAER